MSKRAVHVKCWKCDQSFSSNKDRKNHMSSSDHSCMSVICPFCQNRKTFKRITPELRDHVRTYHPMDLAGLKDLYKEFFSEANGYWLAAYPRDYRALIIPNGYDAAAALRARDQVKAWIRKAGVPESANVLSEWEVGWRMQKGSRRPPSVEPESHFVPDYEEREPTPKRPRTEYAPDTPEVEIGTLNIQEIQSNGDDGMQALLYTEGDNPVWYKAVLSKDLYNDPKSVASIMRRALTTKMAGVSPPITMLTVSIDVSTSTTTRKLLCAIADTLGVLKRYLHSLQFGATFGPVEPLPSQTASKKDTAESDRSRVSDKKKDGNKRKNSNQKIDDDHRKDIEKDSDRGKDSDRKKDRRKDSDQEIDDDHRKAIEKDSDRGKDSDRKKDRRKDSDLEKDLPPQRFGASVCP
ncbi:hypothetical protein FSP39_003179 [Pinctada imbricata]|uniref:C2H2-type domain-containing protein n=1 Tax=Pinctada imbricata TaxID=66713 RepID=A0AA88Y151_PINIB|nr:hypothetical protein FSP39_003179 [Pinctada imbricata]